MKFFLLGLAVLCLVGSIVWYSGKLSHIGTPADPNNPRHAGILTPEIIRKTLSGASDSLQQRIAKDQNLSDAQLKKLDVQFHQLMADLANEKLKDINISRIPPAQAWEYGEIYITARRWEDARATLETAVKVATTEDRRVNDSLRLARVMAELGDVKECIRLARSTFNTGDTDAAPILPATLLEIVPAAKGKGLDADLAALLEGAIQCELRTIIDPKTVPGKDFLAARPIHIRHAWKTVVSLYEAAGKGAEAKAARAKGDAMLSKMDRA